MKTDLLKYLEETKLEYLNPEQPYVNKDELPNLWIKRKTKIDALPEKVEFEVIEQIQIAGPRIYVNSNSQAYRLIRELSLPNITFISVVKLLDENSKFCYYFRLFADYFGEVEHPYVIEKEQGDIIDSDVTQE